MTFPTSRDASLRCHRLLGDAVDPPPVGHALQFELAVVRDAEPRAGGRILTVLDTRTSPGPASAATRAAMWTARPPLCETIRSPMEAERYLRVHDRFLSNFEARA